MSVSTAIRQRISVRQFLATPVSEAQVRALLDTARWAPSGGNLQPWKIIAVAGAEREAVIAVARAELARSGDGVPREQGSDLVYPPKLWEPYRSRRFQVGEDMYALMGIAREDRAARLAHVARNFEFFGAPVGLFFVIDRRMGRAQWAHLGMFMQTLALAALEMGLGTCMQEFWGTIRESLHRHFALPETDLIYCGMSLGHADPRAPVNALRSARAPVDEFASLRGF
ncbi:MAG: nitroreductase [Proteobacteria bacterium]|nr:nitroreductase [Pseudomonadota bacterium]